MWQNIAMPRWLPIALAALAGIGLGLFYGWVVSPVEFSEITPEALRIDFRTDYVLMVAEAFRLEGDEAAAARRLAILGGRPPGILVAEAYTYAEQAEYPADDLAYLQELAVALQAWQPLPGTVDP